MCRFVRWSEMSFAFLCYCCVAFGETKEELLAKGKVLWERKDYDASIQVFTKAIEIDGTCADAYYGRGIAHAAKGDYQAAVEDLSETVRRTPQKCKAYLNRGRVYLAKGQTSQAISDLTQAIQLDAKEAMAYSIRSAAYLAGGDCDRAIADANEAIRLNPRDASAFGNRSGAYVGKGDYSRAITDATQAIRLDPECTFAYSNRARAYGALGKHDEAISDYRRAIALDPKRAEYYLSVAGVYFAKGDVDEALANSNEAVRLSPGSAGPYWQRGTIRLSRREIDGAIDDLNATIRLDPGNASAYASRGEAYAQRRERDKAIADFDVAIGLTPNWPCLYERRGALWIEVGDYDRGIADIQTAIRLNPLDTAATYEAWAKSPVSEEAIQHGDRQVRRMLHDRPEMGRYAEEAKVLYDWAARKYAGEDLNRRVLWETREPVDAAAANDPFPMEEPGTIMVSEKHPSGPDKGKDRSFEELWCSAVFELYNITNAEDFLRLARRAGERKLSRNEFVSAMIGCESRAAEKTRAFCVHVFLPWAREHHVRSDPALWFVGWRTDPKDNLLRGRFKEKDSYWRHYERSYDLIVLDSLSRKGEYQKALDLSQEMRKQVQAPEERATICGYSGYCLLRLNRPSEAVDAYDELIRCDPKDAHAYLGRARAYAILNDIEGTIADCSEAIRLRPSNPDAYVMRGEAYKAMGETERADADLAMAKGLTELQRDEKPQKRR